MFSRRRAENETLLLRVVRFRKLLEEARSLVNLCRDADEKFHGDYIFDRQYILSLIDRATEIIGNLVFNAHVLAPKGGESLFADYDSCKKEAQENLLTPSGEIPRDDAPGDDLRGFEDGPEYRLLAKALRWLNGPLPDGRLSVMDVMKRVFDKVLAGFESAIDPVKKGRLVEINCRGVKNVIEAVDLETPEEKMRGEPFQLNPHCKPLGVMAIGASDEKMSGKPTRAGAVRQWSATLNAEQLSLFSGRAGAKVILDACLTGYRPSDFIFLYSDSNRDLERLAPAGFQLQKTERGAMAWRYDVSDQELEKSLIVLGETLFGC